MIADDFVFTNPNIAILFSVKIIDSSVTLSFFTFHNEFNRFQISKAVNHQTYSGGYSWVIIIESRKFLTIKKHIALFSRILSTIRL